MRTDQPIELRQVHLQRLRAAIAAAAAGAQVVFVILDSEPKTVAWRDSRDPRSQHVVLCAWGRIEDWLAAVQAEFDRATKKCRRKPQ